MVSVTPELLIFMILFIIVSFVWMLGDIIRKKFYIGLCYIFIDLIFFIIIRSYIFGYHISNFLFFIIVISPFAYFFHRKYCMKKIMEEIENKVEKNEIVNKIVGSNSNIDQLIKEDGNEVNQNEINEEIIKKEVLSMIPDWPSYLLMDRLLSINLKLVVAKLKSYETMAHPRDITTSKMNVPLIYPKYDDRGRRQGIAYEDQKICSVTTCDFTKNRKHNLDQRTIDIATEVIVYYTKTPLAKSVLQIPLAYLAVSSKINNIKVTKPPIMEVVISQFKMMENIYYEMYEELEEGTITDDMVDKKFMQILFSDCNNFFAHTFTGVLDGIPSDVYQELFKNTEINLCKNNKDHDNEAPFIHDFEVAQTEFENALNSRRFDTAVSKMQNVFDKYPISKNMFFANATLSKAYMGLALQYFPGAEFMDIEDFKNEQGLKYCERLNYSLQYSKICINLWDSNTYKDHLYGLTVDINDYNYIKELERKVNNRLNM